MLRFVTTSRSENGCGKWHFIGLKLGQDLENRAAHPHREFPGVPPLDLVCYEPFLVSSRNDPPHKLRDETQPRPQGFSLGKALGTRLEETKNGCVADYPGLG